MTEIWGVARFGDPCRECGFSWTITGARAIDIVRGIPSHYREIAAGATGYERHPDLGWNVTEYVCHVTDNLRNWAERLIGVIKSGELSVGAYDQDALGEARQYDRVPLVAALWSLDRAVAAWIEATTLALDYSLVLVHDTRGRMAAIDVVHGNAHDAHHHGWDIERILAYRA